MNGKLGPRSANLVLLGAGPLTVWALVMLLLIGAGEADYGPGRFQAQMGLLVFAFLGALACRRAINVLRRSRAGAVSPAVLIGIVALSQAPVSLWFRVPILESIDPWSLLMQLGGLTAAVSGVIIGLRAQGSGAPRM